MVVREPIRTPQCLWQEREHASLHRVCFRGIATIGGLGDSPWEGLVGMDHESTSRHDAPDVALGDLSPATKADASSV
jgi:hypothetical protein